MQSQRAIFSLKGTNISLPNRYKIRRHKAGKSKSEKQDKNEDQLELELPFIIEAKQPIPSQVRRNLIKNQLMASQQQPYPTHISTVQPTTINLTNSKNITENIYESDSKLGEKRSPITIIKRGKQHYSSMKTKRCACGDCPQCMKDFGYFLHLFSDDQSVPDISAKSWCIWKRKNGKFLYYYGKRIHKVREIASLTKMVTAMAVIDFLAKYGWELHRIRYAVKKTSILVGGTTANLGEGQVCNLLELLYGMMLPSGNDAAIALSEAIGLLSFIKNRNKQVDPYSPDWYVPYASKNYSYIFIGLMNEKCQRVGTLDSRMFNSHGNDAYDQLKNVSTCNEVAKLSSEFMTYPLLKEIVKTPRYGPFENTNKLLQDGFDGIKTGITDTAGPCFSASYKEFIIVVLNSKSMNERWIEVKKLVKWILKRG